MYKIKQWLFIISFAALAAIQSHAASALRVECVSRPQTTPGNAHYPGNRAPLHPSYFIKLPVGSIQPQGWLRECLLRQRNGLTGNLHKISNFLTKENNAWLSPTGEGNHRFEEVPYWLKGYSSLAYTLNDPDMIAEAQTWFEGVFGSQQPDGYFGALMDRKGIPDLFGNMVMLWALQTYYEHSNDERVITLMKNYFRWQLSQPADKFLKTTAPWEKLRAGDNIYSVYWLYNHTGEKWLLDVAEKIHRAASDWKQECSLPIWHNVDIAQGFREPATWWIQSRDDADLRATYNNFALIRRTYGQVPGGMFGADEHAHQGYIDPRQATETCGFVEQMASDELLLRITGDGLWADNCEDVAFNSLPAAFMPDYKSLRYFTSPNQIVSDNNKHHPAIYSVEAKRAGYFLYNPTSHRCCQHNHAQGWPYYAENLWLATSDNGLAAVFLCASNVTAKVAGGTEVTITETTNYPFEEQARFKISLKQKQPVRFPLYLRIPSWCDNARVTINGKPVSTHPAPSSYLRIENDWKNGDQVMIELPMRLQVRQWQVNQNSLSVNYGPLTFSLKIDEQYKKVDSKSVAIRELNQTQKTIDWSQWPAWEVRAGSAWNYGLQCDTSAPEKLFTVIKKPWPADNFPFTQKSAPIEIKAQGKKIPLWTPTETGFCSVLPPYPAQTENDAEEITLIPMGAARLRISAFPPVH